MTPETKLKNDCRRSAKQHGCGMHSTSIKGRRGFPDHLVICPERAVVFVEFKTPKGSLSPHQQTTIEDLRRAGAEVWVVRSLRQFEELLGDALERVVGETA